MHDSHILEQIFITTFKLISTNFLREKCMSKINTKEAKPKQIVNDTKTVENIKYQVILSQLAL